MRNPALKILISSLLLVMPQLVHADEIIEYQFDMILFENNDSREAYLADHAARAFINHQLDLDDSAESDQVQPQASVYESDSTAISYRENATGQLENALTKLQKSSRYRVLARKSWTQSGFQDGDSIKIDIDATDPMRDPADITLLPGEGDDSSKPYLSGSVTFSFSRYIHLKTDLSMDHTASNSNTGLPLTQNADSSHIVLKRKLRSGETHYIDHPLIGVLINILRVKVQDSES